MSKYLRFIVMTEMSRDEIPMSDDEVERMLEEVEDVGYELPISYLKDRFSWLYGYNKLPQAGGVDDQDAAFVRDLGRMFLVKRSQRWLLKEKAANEAPPKEKRKNWQDLM